MVTNIGDALAAYRNATKQALSSDGQNVASVSFSEVLKEAGGNVLSTVQKGEQMMTAGALGKASVTDVITAVASAESTLQAVIAVRDRVVSAYQEILKTPI